MKDLERNRIRKWSDICTVGTVQIVPEEDGEDKDDVEVVWYFVEDRDKHLAQRADDLDELQNPHLFRV